MYPEVCDQMWPQACCQIIQPEVCDKWYSQIYEYMIDLTTISVWSNYAIKICDHIVQPQICYQIIWREVCDKSTTISTCSIIRKQ